MLAINLICRNCLQRIESLNSKSLKNIINGRDRKDGTKNQKRDIKIKRDPQISRFDSRFLLFSRILKLIISSSF